MNEAMDIFMAIFGLHRLQTYLQPCRECVVAKGFVECDADSYGWVG